MKERFFFRKRSLPACLFLLFIPFLLSPVHAGVSIDISGSSTQYLGDTIILYGENYVSDPTYLFITGPNLPANGAQIKSLDPRNNAVVDGDPSTFRQASVLASAWSWNWDTHTLNLDPGTYTLYAESDPHDLANIESSACSASTTLVLVEPVLSASLSQSTVNAGDPLTADGTATGSPAPGVACWVLGENYLARSTAVVAGGSFSCPITTTDLDPGTFDVIVQHPMGNDQFDLTLSGNDLVNMQLGAGTKIATVKGSGSLMYLGWGGFRDLFKQAFDDVNIDDG